MSEAPEGDEGEISSPEPASPGPIAESEETNGVVEAPGGTDEAESAQDTDIATRRTFPGTWVWWVLAVGLVAIVLAYLAWRDADSDPERARAQLRDQAVIEGSAAIETMNSMDARDVDAGLKAWRSVTTGVLHDQLLQVGDDESKLLADQGKIATGRVVEAALTQLTDRTATLIAAVEVSVTDEESEKDPDQEPAVKRNRYSADLVLVDGAWKLENLGQVPVGLS